MPLGLVERKKQSKRQGDVSPERGSELYKETEITKTFEHNVFLDEVLKQKNTPKSQGKRIAIIGEPGAGKTTLLQQIADWVSREIDQSIIIWVSLADLRGQELKSYLFETWLTQVAEKIGKAEATKQLKDDFVALFNQKNVWLLLDGLDEMSASNPLTEIARQFREGGLISQVRIVLTCRVNLWDGSINALDDFDTYRSLDFSYPQQVERFIHRWFAAIPETGKQLCTALKESGKERIQDLVKNPLRLTLLCLNWQSGDGKLPNTQAGLYQQFVDDFDKWKKAEFVTNSKQRQQLNVKLGELAKAAILDKKETRFRLRQDSVTQFLGDADDEHSLLKLALNLGWLNRVGIDTNRKPVYAFFHASFQEYFAAKAIDDWHFFLNHIPKNPSQGTYRIFEPQWKQTILLWLGREEENLKQQKQQFIDALVSFKDGCRKFYEYRTYFLAAVGIAEFRDYLKADEIIAQIVKWTIANLLITEEAKSVLQQTDRTKAIAALVQLLQSTTLDDITRSLAAESLCKIDPGNEFAIAALVQLLQSTTVDDSTRRNVAESLGKIGTSNEFVIAALVQILRSTTVDDDTRGRAADSLGEIGTDNEIAIAALVQVLQSTTVDDLTHRMAAQSLGRIGTGNEIEIAALVQVLQSTTMDDLTRRMAAQSLGRIGTGNEIEIAALVQMLQSITVDDYTRGRAADSLGEIGTGNEFAIAALVQILQSTTVDDYTRYVAVSSLGRIGTGNEIEIAALVQVLQSTAVDEDTRSQAVSSLGEIGTGNEIEIAALVEVLQSTTVDDDTHGRAVSSLGKIGTSNEFAIAALVQILRSTTVNDDTRGRAAESLGKIDPGNEFAIAALVQILQSTTVDNYTRRMAAQSLERIGTGNEKVIAALVEVLQSTTVDDDSRRWAASTLGEIGAGNEFAIAALVQLLQSTTVDDYTRYIAVCSLEDIAPNHEIVITANEIVIAALVQLLQSNNIDDNIRIMAASNLGRIGTGNEIAISALVQVLQSTTVDDYTHNHATYSLRKIIQDKKHRFAVVKALSGYWQLNDQDRFLAWEYAQNMPYPDFYQAWHQHNFATRAMRSLKKILFTRII